MADNTISVDVELAIAQAQKDIAALQSQFTAFGVNLQNVMGKADTAMAVFHGSILAMIAEKGFEILEEAAKKFFEVFLVQGVEAASEFGMVVTELNTSLALSGKYTQETSDSLIEYATSLSRATTVADDTIIKSMGLIEVLGNLDEKGLKRATKDSLDLAAALAGRGLSVEAAANLVAKASVGSTAGLVRYGIVIDQTGTVAERYAKTLALIESKFPAAASAQTNTYAGATRQLGNAFHEVQQEIGFMITRNPVVLEAIHMLTEGFYELVDWIAKNRVEITEFISNGIVIAADAFEVLLEVMDLVVRGFELAYYGWQTFENALVAGSARIQKAFTGGLLDAVNKFADESEAKFMKSAQGFHDAWSEKGALGHMANFVSNAAVKLATHVSDVIKAGGHIKNSAAGVATEEIKYIGKTHDTWLQTFLGQSAMRDKVFALQTAKEHLAHAKDAAEKRKYMDEEAKAYNELQTAKMTSAMTAIGTIATLTSSKNKELFFIGKAAAISQAVINTAQGVTKAWADTGVFGAILAPLVAAAGAAQIAVIAAQQPAFAGGGIMGGNSYSGDRNIARVNSGEMFVNTQQQAGLWDFIKNGSQGSGSGGNTFNFYNTMVDSPARVNKIIEQINKQVLSGTPLVASRVNS